MRRLGFVLSCLGFVLLLAGPRAAGAAEKENGSRLPDIDKQSERSVREPRSLSPAEQKLVKPGKAIQYEERLGVPTFLWAAPSVAPREEGSTGAKKADVADEARRHAEAMASVYGLEKGDVAKAKVVQVHDTGSGAIIVKFQEDIGGIEVFREELSVMMDRNLEPIALLGVPQRCAEADRRPGRVVPARRARGRRARLPTAPAGRWRWRRRTSSTTGRAARPVRLRRFREGSRRGVAAEVGPRLDRARSLQAGLLPYGRRLRARLLRGDQRFADGLRRQRRQRHVRLRHLRERTGGSSTGTT